MNRLTTHIAVLAVLSGGALLAQDRDITGTWQGTWHPDKDVDVRIAIRISKADNGGLKAVMYRVDDASARTPVRLPFRGSIVRLSVLLTGFHYEGKLANGDGTATAMCPAPGILSPSPGPDAR